MSTARGIVGLLQCIALTIAAAALGLDMPTCRLIQGSGIGNVIGSARTGCSMCAAIRSSCELACSICQRVSGLRTSRVENRIGFGTETTCTPLGTVHAEALAVIIRAQ